MTPDERIAALEAECAALRAEVEHWRELSKNWTKAAPQVERSYPVGMNPGITHPQAWPKGTIVTTAPTARGMCDTCAAKMARGEPAVCGCIAFGPKVTC